MEIFEGLAMAIALGTDAFSVAMVVGVRQFNALQIMQISNTIGIFHIFMPLLGFYGGDFIKRIIIRYFSFNASLDNVFNLIGAGLLMLIGFYMILESRLEQNEGESRFQCKGWGLMMLAVSVSIDSLSTGVSLGMLGFNITVVLIFGLVAGIMMASGLYLGSKIGHWFGDSAHLIGGLALIYMGFNFSGLI